MSSSSESDGLAAERVVVSWSRRLAGLAAIAKLASVELVGALMNRRWGLVFLLAWSLAGIGVTQAHPQKVVGEIVKLDGSALQLKASDGQALTVRLEDKTRLSARSGADAAKLVAGAYIGTTAVPQPDGTLSAVEVHVFPESMRGTGEGHRPMDSAPGSTMTNATIASVAGGRDAKPRDTTTNATVTRSGGDGPIHRLTLSYRGGEKVVVVPDKTPIVMWEPADRSLLVPGAHVVVYVTKQPDGSLTADRLTVGKNGFVPPM